MLITWGQLAANLYSNSYVFFLTIENPIGNLAPLTKIDAPPPPFAACNPAMSASMDSRITNSHIKILFMDGVPTVINFMGKDEHFKKFSDEYLAAYRDMIFKYRDGELIVWMTGCRLIFKSGTCTSNKAVTAWVGDWEHIDFRIALLPL